MLIPFVQLLYRLSVSQTHKMIGIKNISPRNYLCTSIENIYKHRHALEVLTQTNTETQVREHTRISQYFFTILLRFESNKNKTPIYLFSLSIKRRIVEISLAKLAKESMNKNYVDKGLCFCCS